MILLIILERIRSIIMIEMTNVDNALFIIEEYMSAEEELESTSIQYISQNYNVEYDECLYSVLVKNQNQITVKLVTNFFVFISFCLLYLLFVF